MDTVIRFRASSEDRARFEAAAKHAGLKLSEWVRETLNAACGTFPVPRPDQLVSIPATPIDYVGLVRRATEEVPVLPTEGVVQPAIRTPADARKAIPKGEVEFVSPLLRKSTKPGIDREKLAAFQAKMGKS